MATTPNLTTATATSTSTSTVTTATHPFTASSVTTKTPPRPQNSHYPIPYQQQNLFAPQNLPIRPQTQTPNPNSLAPPQGILYPVASSGRGFIPRPVRPQDQTVTVAKPNLTAGSYNPRPFGVVSRPTVVSGSPRSHPYSDGGSIHNSHSGNTIRQHPTQLQHQQQHYVGGAGSVGVGSAPIKGIPVTGQLKVAPSTSPFPVSDSNGHRDFRDRSRDDVIVTVRDRKVRISDGASLYELCRSWLRNGLPEESQPQFGESVRSLPKPLPIPVVDTLSPKKEGEEVGEDKEDEESVDHLSTQDLLKRHINRAKKIRARLRGERLKRIDRYKTRLALLLPPQMEQFRNAAAGN